MFNWLSSGFQINLDFKIQKIIIIKKVNTFDLGIESIQKIYKVIQSSELDLNLFPLSWRHPIQFIATNHFGDMI